MQTIIIILQYYSLIFNQIISINQILVKKIFHVVVSSQEISQFRERKLPDLDY